MSAYPQISIPVFFLFASIEDNQEKFTPTQLTKLGYLIGSLAVTIKFAPRLAGEKATYYSSVSKAHWDNAHNVFDDLDAEFLKNVWRFAETIWEEESIKRTNALDEEAEEGYREAMSKPD